MIFSRKSTVGIVPSPSGQSAALHDVGKVRDSAGKINELLRRADALLKAGLADDALHLTREARGLDPRNAYGEAMEERVLHWLSDRTQRPPTPAAPAPIAHREPPPEPPKPLPAPVVSPVPSPLRTERPAKPTQILLVDDDDMLRQSLSEAVEVGGYEPIGVGSGEEALVLLQKLTPDLVLCDVNLGSSGFGGFTLLERVLKDERLNRIPFVFLTGLHDDVLLRTGKELGADDYLTKPISQADLLAVLRGKLKRYRRLSTPAGSKGPA